MNSINYSSVYSMYLSQRTRPVLDLLSGLQGLHIEHAVDLGCGPGNSTAVISHIFKGVDLLGIDSSRDMLDSAKQALPNCRFELADIADWTPTKKYDLICANASLQWVPDHKTLYPKLFSFLKSNGVLAIQTPDNFQEPAYVLLNKLAKTEKWYEKLSEVKREPRESAEWYFDLLSKHTSKLDIWRTTYYQKIPNGINGIVDWLKGGALIPYLAKLDEADKSEFLYEYTFELSKAYKKLSNGEVLFPFPRLFIHAFNH